MSNNFKNKKRDLTKKVDFSGENDNVENIMYPNKSPFEAIQPNNVSTDKNTEKIYICINLNDYSIGNINQIEKYINDNDISDDDIEIFELKSKNPVNFSIRSKLVLNS